jgi:hypothetical protein
MLPISWDAVSDPAPDVALIALEPTTGTGEFRTNLVLTIDRPGPRSLGTWQTTCEQALATALTHYHLIDLERQDIAGHPGGRRLAHHVSPAGIPLTLHQWFTLGPGLACTLSATVSTARSPVTALVFPQLAHTLQFGGTDG